MENQTCSLALLQQALDHNVYRSRVGVMKKLLLALLVGTLLVGCGSESSSNRKDRGSDSSSDHTSEEKQLIGEWKGTDSTGSTASMIFNDDGSAIFIEGRKVMDGAAIGGSVTWELDSNHDPMHLDLIVSKSTGETRTAQAIIRFLGENKIQITMNKATVYFIIL